MAHPVVEHDEDIFPEPHTFIPERWMGSNAQDLEKWSVSFSKGRRQCIATKYVFPRIMDLERLAKTVSAVSRICNSTA
jgi:hypothetical protein